MYELTAQIHTAVEQEKRKKQEKTSCPKATNSPRVNIQDVAISSEKTFLKTDVLLN